MIIIWISIILVLILFSLATYFDEKTGHIPNILFYISFTVGVLINIWYFTNTQEWLIFAGIQLALILAIFFVPEKYIGGGDLKLYSGAYALIPNYNFLILLVLFASLMGFVDSKFKKKKNILFAKYLLISYIIILLSALYNKVILSIFV